MLKRHTYKTKPLLTSHIVMCLLFLFIFQTSFGQNPLIRDQFTADPTARVIGDKIFIFASHDIKCDSTQGRPNWFCMEDYHVFSSSNLTDWEDHGMILSQYQVPWADSESFSMWAPDGIEKDGKYYFYFPSKANGHHLEGHNPEINGSSFKIGVAIADSPDGPYVPEEHPIAKVDGIDPNVFIDHDGQAYLYWSQHHFYGAKLSSNMKELQSDPIVLSQFPDEGLKEGPFVFERNGIYYMTYPHVANKTERIEYATADNPLGPFTFQGVIMDESPTDCWTNHQSVVKFQNQWYFFYHHNEYSPDFDKNRSVMADSLFFDENGLIQKITPSLRGIGLTAANSKIKLDRYSAKSDEGYDFGFIDKTNPFLGWKSVFDKKGSWVKYNQVDFGDDKPNRLHAKIKAIDAIGHLEFRLGSGDGKLVTKIDISEAREWAEHEAMIESEISGIHDLVLVFNGTGNVEVDWISFKKM